MPNCTGLLMENYVYGLRIERKKYKDDKVKKFVAHLAVKSTI
jgi:hypothetical protein